MKLEFTTFVKELQKGKTEEDIKNVYARHFNIKYDTSERHDLYTPQVLFEFKYDRNLESLKGRAAVLAQNLYYVHKLKFGITNKPIPQNLCVADKNEAFFAETLAWKDFYTTDKYDWDLAPSHPDQRLIKDISETEALRNIHVFQIQKEPEYQVFSSTLKRYFDLQTAIFEQDKKVITEQNFEEVFEYWNSLFGDSVRNGLKPSRYFVSDIQEGRTIPMKDLGQVVFQFPNDAKVKKIFWKDYEYFWNTYQKISNPDVMRGIVAKIDRLTDDTMRRFHGEFFTPIKFAKKALDYLEITLGKNWWASGEYRLWDMACGTGNLEYYLPTDALPSCYLSTLYREEVEHIERLFSSATCFQYDYLNDDIDCIFGGGLFQDWKLPKNLRNDLANPKIKWVILINPPFATSQTAGTSGATSKKDVSDTQIRKVMHKQNLGEVSRELFAQFLYRIKHEFHGKKAHLGLFSKLKYINANNDQKFRDTVFQFAFEQGFVFSSVNFSGTSKASQFPVGFLIWNLSNKQLIDNQKVTLDVFDVNVEKISKKNVLIEHRDKFLSKWINRPAAKIKFPPFGSSINIKHDNKDPRDRVGEGFLASLMCCGNDIQHQNFTAFLSGPYVSAGALSVTPENFEQAMVVHAVRRIPKANWINDRDQFLKPNQEISQEFVNDCTVWNLFSNSNETVSMRNVKYENKNYEIVNHFFPFLKSEIKKWKITDPDILLTLSVGEERFMANWLINKKLSIESESLFSIGREIYQQYFTHLHQIRTQKFKIETWDAGWWQVRNALQEQNIAIDLFEELKEKHTALKHKIRPQIDTYGFLG